jgi:TPR repeat protein
VGWSHAGIIEIEEGVLSREKEPEELSKLREDADQGDPQAQGQLGTMLVLGDVVTQDLDEGVKWLMLAADQNDIASMFNLGIIYEQGLGVTVDPDEAGLWYWKAAEKGDAGAKMKLGTMLIKGVGFAPGSQVTQSVRASAEKGVPYAQAFLGKLYLEGVGVEQDDTGAEGWFRKAADQGDESALFNLGEMMSEDRTVETSKDEVAQWFYDFGMTFLRDGNIVKAFDCLVSIKRNTPDHFLAQRLESEIDRQNESGPRGQ